ncbi:RHS repeat-associated protein [Ruminiclostridium sufflavum DSM 19573]|uniref:RHS repeat-associated protein n=1 Tax=Ruminiclostridium sufflavum DSM 19573 TaxID=1121337 RepID=A0A318XIB8_9FIRM|nr:RHS repeat-associated core domain-containing protein [Ruminiclostridium sufflavum]PYG83894.1 RHS repeat-associated protein [Ruminiclostridium sufflavum DSM 19573]
MGISSYIIRINYIASIDSGNNTAYFLYNGHGDVGQTVDEAGEVQNQYDYDIWGNPTLTVETAENSIRYAGEFFDNETGLYYLRARYYDPYIGRFTTEDSYWGEDENPLSLNLYTYCANDPIQYVDPSGHKYYVDENGKGHVSEITVGWNTGLNPNIIYDNVIFEGDHANVTTNGAQINSVSGNSDIVESYSNSKESSTFMYIPETMTLDTIVTGKSASLDDAIKTSFYSEWNKNLANDKTPYAAKQLLPTEMYNIMRAPGERQTMNALNNMFGEDYYNAAVQRSFDQNMQIVNGLLLVASLGTDFVGALEYNMTLEAKISEVTASVGKGTVNSVPQVQTTRVGRWMSQAEYDTMVKTGKVQMSPNGNTTYVANLANPNAFKAASNGSVYVEFDVPKNSIYPAGNENWGQISGPGSLMDRLNQSKGLAPD